DGIRYPLVTGVQTCALPILFNIRRTNLESDGVDAHLFSVFAGRLGDHGVRADRCISRRSVSRKDQIHRAFAAISYRQRRVWRVRSEEHTSELQSRVDLVCRL